ncbi:MAG: LLM class F420-dependent oxidoreductase [Acidimicrobiales bacterium]|nr:MAG: LLM class F420-dependent oxidoreductase [Acidimicrobiales bacterium]
MKIAVQVNYAGDYRAWADMVATYEQAGADMVWVAEAYGFDGVSLLGYLAARTERMELAAGILPIFSRTPTLIAQTAAGLDALSGGRFHLGLGASGPQVVEGWHGVPYDHPLERTREIVDICRKVWARREPLVHRGRYYEIPLPPEQGTGLGKPLKIINRPLRERIPIWIAALGAKNVELAAEVAEGWLPIFFLPERASEVWGEALERGREKRSEDLGPLQVAAGGLLAIGDDMAGMAELARPMVALYVGGMGARGRNFYNDLMKRYGWEGEAEKIQDLYLDGKKDEAAAVVPREMLELTNLCGPASWVAERVAAYREAGVTVLNVVPVGGDPAEQIAKLRELLAG